MNQVRAHLASTFIRTLHLLCSMLLVVTTATVVHAQLPAGDAETNSDNARRETNYFFEALREVQWRGGPDRELMELLFEKKIREEVHLSDSDWDAARKIIEDGMVSVRKLKDELQQEKDREKIVERIISIQQPVLENLRQHLNDKSNFERLVGLYVQARGYRAALNTEVAKRIGIDEDKVNELRDSKSDEWRKLMDENRSKIFELTRAGKRDEASKVFDKISEKIDHCVACKLSDDQRKKLDELKGEPFDLPKNLFDLGGRRDGRGPENRNESKPSDGEKRDRGKEEHDRSESDNSNSGKETEGKRD